MKKRILWICNMILPQIAEQFHLQANVKEGWISGLLDTMITNHAFEEIELAIAFPILDKEMTWDRKIVTVDRIHIATYGFHELLVSPEQYQSNLEIEMKQIINNWNPDIVHCFGTEYPHTLAAVLSFHQPDKTVIGIQGLCGVYGECYLDALPSKVVKKHTLRDMIKKDNLKTQQTKFLLRGKYEHDAILKTTHIIGRTHWDYEHTKKKNPNLTYHKMNETLRDIFYHNHWEYKDCNPYQLFISQGDYPIKGLHYLLLALPSILKKYPETKVRIAGNNILKSRLKLSAYGMFIQQLIEKLKLKEQVQFIGPKDANEMLQEYKKAHLFICPSTMENSPNSVGEAMILGMPIVTSNVGGILSIIHPEEGFIYDGYHLENQEQREELKRVTHNLKVAILEAFSNVDEAARRGQKAREHAMNTHNKEANYKKLLEIYEAIYVMK